MNARLGGMRIVFPRGVVTYLLILCSVVGAVTLYLLATASANTALFAQHYPVLLGLNGGLAACLAALLGYQLYSLRQKLKAGVFGSKLTLRLVLLFTLVAVLPGALVYGVSVQFVARSIESWFDTRVEKALEGGLNLGRSTLDNLLKDLARKGDAMAGALSGRPPAEHVGALYALREQAGSDVARRHSRLVIGPWAHGMFHNVVGELDFGFRANGLFLDLKEDLTRLQLRWFDRWLKHDGAGDDEAPVKIKKEAPQETRFEKNYMQMDKELMTNITGSKKVMVIQVALMTHYDERVFENVKKHDFALRSTILDILRQVPESEVNKPEFRVELARKIRDAMNTKLEKYEDFGGIEEVFYTNFVIQ